MNIIISGYGRMGKEVEKLALQQGHEVLYRLDTEADWHAAGEGLRKGEVVIDFSQPHAVVGNIRRAFDRRLPVVTGTTGWYDRLPEAREWCEKEGQALFVAANFSIGVNVMLLLAGKMARLVDRFGEYELSIEEIHHVHKLDSPSGTAIKLAEAVLDSSARKKSWTAGQARDASELEVSSRREGEVPGTHILKAQSGSDILEIVHRARSREGFATGALMAARWIQGKQGFHTMKDLLEFTD